ncbi:hypothetical protein [Streptomyces sp. NPDC056061]|uniref:hypothetical protein n=1 Tax=Streptomyces sp. NPDC056061 TaxID=3345700 RepID=UPI0035DB0A4B
MTADGVADIARPQAYEPPERPVPVPEDVVAKAVAQAGAARSSGDRPEGRETVTVTDLTGVPQAHCRGHTGKGVTVGIIGSGTAYDRPALGGGGFPDAGVLGGHDFADEDGDPCDEPTRTAQRRIQALMQRSGASTRIRLGWYARHHGWA